MPDNDESAYADLVTFLSSDRPDLRAKAAEAAAAVSADPATASSATTDDNAGGGGGSSSSSSAEAAEEKGSSQPQPATIAAGESAAASELVRAGAVPPLCRLISHPGSTGLDALSSLLNISSGLGPSAAVCVEQMADSNAAGRLTEIALCSPPPKSKGEGVAEAWRKRTNLCLALLVNLTRSEKGAVEFCGRSLPEEAVYAKEKKDGEKDGEEGKGDVAVRKEAKPAVTLLLGRFLLPMLTHETEDSWKGSAEEIAARSDDPFQHFASVLMNATQVEQGRRFVLRLTYNAKKDGTSTSVLQSLLPSLRHANPVRRRGIAGTIKNCAFDADFAWWLLNELDITKHLLYPLHGPEELEAENRTGLEPELWLEGPEKVREPDRDVRLLLVETLLLLCATGRKSRETLRAKRTYVILKTMDLAEEDADVSSRIDECVQYLRRDEEGMAEVGEGDGDGGTPTGNLLALPAPQASEEEDDAVEEKAAAPAADFDEVD